MNQFEFQIKGLPKQQFRNRRRLNHQGVLRPRLILSTLAIVGTIFILSPANHLIREVVRQTGVSPRQAAQALEVAQLTNARGEIVLNEVVDKANALRAAAAKDSPAASDVRSIAFTAVGGKTEAVIAPAVSGVSVQYTVSGTDRYYDSSTLQTDAAGRVSFAIPRPRRAGVLDTISASVVLNGRTAKATYSW